MERGKRYRALFFIWIMIIQLLAPVPGLALSGGNKAPEFESFQPFGLDNMVDPATGDFSYNIPLMNVGFHGINLFYQGGVTMEQEATMVGLGWNINSGMINRTVRGIPDDFKGDLVEKQMYYKPNVTVGLRAATELEIVGSEMFKLKAGVGVSYNNMDGIGFDWSLTPSFDATKWAENEETADMGSGAVNQDTVGFGISSSLNISSSTHGGMSLSPNLTFARKIKNGDFKNERSIGIGTSINSRSGMKGVSMSRNFNITEKNTYKRAPSNSSDFSFSKPSFLPKIDFPTRNSAFTFSASIGPDAFTVFGGGNFSGYYSRQKIETSVLNIPSYGLLYPASNSYSLGLQDFHRAHEGPQNDNIPNLPVPQLDFDTYTISGPGLSGSMQLKRGDLGLVSNRRSFNSSNDNTIGVEIGAGAFSHIGGDITSVSTTTTSKEWSTSNHNNLSPALSFKDDDIGVNYEKAIFQKTDEFSVERILPDNKFSKLLGTEALKPTLSKIPGLPLGHKATHSPSTVIGMQTDLTFFDGKNTERIKRNDNISYMTFEEAEHFAFSKYLNTGNGVENIYKQYLQNGLPGNIEIKKHHIAEIKVDNQDGYRYYYGLPVYNINQTERTFSINGLGANKHKLAYEFGIVNYEADCDKVENEKGKDHFFSSSSLPPFATNYLLTAIVSSDYQDLTGNGPSPDDYGDYVKFNYEKQDGYYSWSSPYSPSGNFGSHNPGLLSNSNDDKVNYIKGERQQYYPKSIENKSEIVTYEYYPHRNDGLESSNISGEAGSNRLKALKRITKFSLPDYLLKSEYAEPLKSVFFEYNYSLCQGVLNNDSSDTEAKGKLTLARLYIINGRSNKGRLSPYIFNYGDIDDKGNNPDYHPKAMNRWSGYQPVNLENNTNELDPTSGPQDQIWYTGNKTCANFPYVPQNQRALQDEFAGAWNLKKIQMPSGGSIMVNYEADDYAYVQDKRAMQMFEIAGVNNSNTFSGSNKLYDSSGNNNFLFFEIKDVHLKNLISGNNSPLDKTILKDEYLRDIIDSLLYFKVFGFFEHAGENYEFVPGWTRIKDYGTTTSGSKKYGFVELQPASINDRQVKNSNLNNQINPISKTIMQAIRLNYPKVVWNDIPSVPDSDDPSIAEEAIRALITTLVNIPAFIRGTNRMLRDRDFGSKIQNKKSLIRLYNPNKKKVAGSHRVKSIIMSDNWDLMSESGFKGVYGKSFSYEHIEEIAGVNRKTSSGVAAYEPIVGGEENCLRMGIPFKEELLLAPDNLQYQEEPLMEDYYPAPRIIYDKFTTHDLFSPSGNVDDLEVYEKTGYAESEFFTYKDYPIKIQNTTIDPKRASTPKIFKSLNIYYEEHLTMAQGYAIIHPQMHGKPKANYNYNSAGQLISGQEYEYQENSEGKLDPNIQALFADGLIDDAQMGLNLNFFGDSKEVSSNTETLGATGNTEAFPIVFVPGILVTVWPKIASELKRFRSLVLVKEIRQNGILRSTTSINGAARIKTENLLWDAETGNPIVTRTFNEFEDPIYQVNLPAHLAYKQMGASYQNINAKVNGVSSNNGIVNFTPNSELDKSLTIGDKLGIFNGNDFEQSAWVLYKENSRAFLIDDTGGAIINISNKTIKVIESGYNNKAGAGIASYTLLKVNPIQGNRLKVVNGVLDASATTYSDQWQTYCGESISYNTKILSIDFENKEIDLNTEYCYKTDEFIAEHSWNFIGPGQLTISDNAQKGHPHWQPCSSNSSGGNILIIDGNSFAFDRCEPPIAVSSLSEPLNILCKSLDVVAGKNYALNVSAARANGASPRLQFKINDQVVGNEFNLDNSATCIWQNFTTHWTSDISGTVELCIIDNLIEGIGNDFVIDYISVTEADPDEEIAIETYCDPSPGNVTNPFINNIKGNWRPKESYVFQTDRQSTDNIEEDGIYKQVGNNYNNQFQNFWSSDYQINPGRWTATNTNTIVSPYGMELEAKDPLNRYSTEVAGYNGQKVIAVAANARLNEIAYNGFEQSIYLGADVSTNQSFYDVLNYNTETGEILLNPSAGPIMTPCASNVHFPIIAGGQVEYKAKLPNSGNFSQRLSPGDLVLSEFNTTPLTDRCIENQPFTPYIVDACDCVPKFAPTVDKKYLISAWLRDDRLDGSEDENGAYLKVEIDGITTDIKTYGPLIEGWRKVEGEFEIGANASGGKIIAANGSRYCYIDDLRIHPYHASMKTYNYDQKTLRFTYEHDDNNYFTKYDYAADGTLERISKQTAKGVQTLQESTFSQQKKIN